MPLLGSSHAVAADTIGTCFFAVYVLEKGSTSHDCPINWIGVKLLLKQVVSAWLSISHRPTTFGFTSPSIDLAPFFLEAAMILLALVTMDLMCPFLYAPLPKFCPFHTHTNIADLFTKTLGRVKRESFLELLMY